MNRASGARKNDKTKEIKQKPYNKENNLHNNSPYNFILNISCCRRYYLCVYISSMMKPKMKQHLYQLIALIGREFGGRVTGNFRISAQRTE